jgi:DNA-binding IclR family transcriptional regulator
MQRNNDGQFVLGPELRRLGNLCPAAFDLEVVVRPALRKIVSATQETASLYVRSGRERICLYRENSPRSARHHLEEGSKRPLTTGAAGKVLVAYDGGKQKESLAVRQDGWAISVGEREPDLAAVAVPLFNAAHRLVGALTVSGLVSRLDRKALMRARDLLQLEAPSLSTRIPERFDDGH